MPLATVPAVVNALRRGRPVIVVDDEDRENEGDVVFAAGGVSPETVAWTVNNSSGFICAPLTSQVAGRLRLPPMVEKNEDPRATAYTVTVDAASRLSTGISAADRAHTLQVLADPGSSASDLTRPGHVLPLIAVDGGVQDRAGHTEAAVDLMMLAGLNPVAGIAEIVRRDGDMMRLPELMELGVREDVLVISIEAIVQFLQGRGGSRSAIESAVDVPEI